MGRRTAATGILLPQGGIVHAGCAPHFLFETSKRKCAAPGGKEKMFGGSVCAGADLLPPAGDGWLSRVEVRDGNVRPLGKPPARGSTGIHPAPIFAAAGRWLMKAAARANATASASTGQRVAKRNARKEKLVKCVLAPRRPPYHPPRVGSHRNRRRPKRARRPAQIGAGTDTPTPVARGGPLHRSAHKRLFLFHRARRILFLGKTKKRMGGASAQPSSWLNPPGGRLPPLRHLRKKAPLWGRGEKKRRPAFRPAALRSAVTPKIPSGSGPPPPPR